jgi:hypothetical protein
MKVTLQGGNNMADSIRLIVCGLVGACVALVLQGLWSGCSATSDGHHSLRDEVIARSISLVDDEGRTRIAMTGGRAGGHYPLVDIYDESGALRIRLTVDEVGAAITLHDENQDQRLALGACMGDLYLNDTRVPQRYPENCIQFIDVPTDLRIGEVRTYLRRGRD